MVLADALGYPQPYRQAEDGEGEADDEDDRRLLAKAKEAGDVQEGHPGLHADAKADGHEGQREDAQRLVPSDGAKGMQHSGTASTGEVFTLRAEFRCAENGDGKQDGDDPKSGHQRVGGVAFLLENRQKRQGQKGDVAQVVKEGAVGENGGVVLVVMGQFGTPGQVRNFDDGPS